MSRGPLADGQIEKEINPRSVDCNTIIIISPGNILKVLNKLVQMDTSTGKYLMIVISRVEILFSEIGLLGIRYPGKVNFSLSKVATLVS